MIYNQKDIWQGKSFEVYGEYSEDEVKLFARILAPTDIVVEVGANIGSLTIPISRIVYNGTVLAFEPERTAFYALAGNIAINNLRNVFVYHQALGKEIGQIRVPELDLEKTDNFGGLELDKDYSNCPHYPVAMNTIDNIGLQKCNLIKIDVEGMESFVLEGAKQTIEKLSPYLIVEDDRTQKSSELRELIKSMGYQMYMHKAPFFNPMNFNGEKENVFGKVVSMNLFCHKNQIDFDPVTEFNMELIS
jgi:FkbM family methyltransferase